MGTITNCEGQSNTIQEVTIQVNVQNEGVAVEEGEAEETEAKSLEYEVTCTKSYSTWGLSLNPFRVETWTSSPTTPTPRNTYTYYLTPR